MIRRHRPARWFRLGALPAATRPILRAESLLLAEEGLRGWIDVAHYRGRGKRIHRRRSLFFGSLLLTPERFMLHAFARRQIHVSPDDPALTTIRVSGTDPDWLCLEVTTETARLGYRLRTDQAARWRQALRDWGMAAVGAPTP